MTNEEINALPFTNHLMPLDEFMQWIETRKDAGAAIDIATCELRWWRVDIFNPYEIPRPRHPICHEIAIEPFVRSPDSRGWINEQDLPPEKYRVLRERLHALRVADQPARSGAALASASPTWSGLVVGLHQRRRDLPWIAPPRSPLSSAATVWTGATHLPIAIDAVDRVTDK
jgi:hypothetical protein